MSNAARAATHKIQILIGRQSDGCAYDLHPTSRQLIRQRFPLAHSAPSVFVGYNTQDDFELYHGPLWGQIALILTGLTASQLEQLGGFEIYDPTGRVIVHDSTKKNK